MWGNQKFYRAKIFFKKNNFLTPPSFWAEKYSINSDDNFHNSLPLKFFQHCDLFALKRKKSRYLFY